MPACLPLAFVPVQYSQHGIGFLSSSPKVIQRLNVSRAERRAGKENEELNEQKFCAAHRF
jgi:hypothetical protein